jgi:lipopolysaccharide/colanic/teichoic acid biosynthesis glycosyltransferase
LKRGLDILVAGTALLILAPLLILVGAWIRLDSAGPALFRQTRVGRFGRSFEILKFRTMCAVQGEEARAITAGADPRITRAGHFLRQHKLDELPQFMNVLKGDMSLVGPRPEVPKYVELYPSGVRERILSVRPGITDFASIEFRHESELLGGQADPERYYVEQVLPRKLDLYLKYIATQSFHTDMKILAATVAAVFKGGAT